MEKKYFDPISSLSLCVAGNGSGALNARPQLYLRARRASLTCGGDRRAESAALLPVYTQSSHLRQNLENQTKLIKFPSYPNQLSHFAQYPSMS
ncbi:hypothetical protein K474DRAFT_1206346 [Panus rudis PR-1116 ss-1]|nr:hypothetical protein K474DRAFT_1206346 [Panus rudis PR-1116 ss-1]